MNTKAYVGTSGWSYQGWRTTFYAGTPKKDWLSFCAQRFTGIEVNATFYGLQKQTTFQRWYDMTPQEFRFTIKGNRFLTHNKKLLNPQELIRHEQVRAEGLAEKLAVVLWLLPINFTKDMDRLTRFSEALGAWSNVHHTLEFRHPSWFDDEVADCLHQHRLAVCISDAADWPIWEQVTTDLVYIRLHGHTRTYASAYGPDNLKIWATKVLGWLQQDYNVHVYFNNDAEGAAPWDAMQLLSMLKQEGEGQG